MNVETLIKRLGRALHTAAQDLEQSHSSDHATQQAHYAAATAVRSVADTIGYVLIGTEDFSGIDDSSRETRMAAVFMLSHVRDLEDEKRLEVMDDFISRMSDILSEGSQHGDTEEDLKAVFASLAIKYKF